MIDQLVVVAGITLLAMVSPGPDIVIVMPFVGGRMAGLQTSAGVLAGNLIHIGYCVVGIGWLISQSILAFTMLKYAAAAYLIYLGVTSLLSAHRTTRLVVGSEVVSSRIWFVQGVINNVLNPKGTLFYLGVFTMVITPETSPARLLLLVSVMMMISAVFWLVFVRTIDLRIVRNTLERGQRAVSCVFGGLLIFLGLRVALMDR